MTNLGQNVCQVHQEAYTSLKVKKVAKCISNYFIPLLSRWYRNFSLGTFDHPCIYFWLHWLIVFSCFLLNLQLDLQQVVRASLVGGRYHSCIQATTYMDLIICCLPWFSSTPSQKIVLFFGNIVKSTSGVMYQHCESCSLVYSKNLMHGESFYKLFSHKFAWVGK